MYERWLDKSVSPTFEDLLVYSGAGRGPWQELDAYLKSEFALGQQIRFPYGNKYGWSSKYSLGKKHICDAFAEAGAFALHFRMSDADMDRVYGGLGEYAKAVCDNKYPCGGGGWLTYRVTNGEQLADARKLLRAKIER